MKKILCFIYVIILIHGFSGCKGYTLTVEAIPADDDYYEAVVYDENTDINTHDIKSMGETIVTAMSFWEEWWELRGRFADEHLVWYSWDDFDDEDEFPVALQYGLARLLPSSGFADMNDVYDYLSLYFTDNWIEHMAANNWPFPFVEHSGVLYIHGARAGFPRTNWETAVNILFLQDGYHTVVRTSALNSVWHMFPNLVFCGDREDFLSEAQDQINRGDSYISPNTPADDIIREVWYIFTFINGLIDRIEELGNIE